MKYLIIIVTFALNGIASYGQQSNDTLCILQLNDVYEIGPLEQGKVGGMAKVATVVKEHEARYQTLVVVAGDFVSPSVIGTTKIDGQRVYGKQMIDLMNKVGVDLVTFGNHEFDIPEKDLQQRINESAFTWLSSDVLHKNPLGAIGPFYKIQQDSMALPTSYLLASRNNQFTIGFVSATIQTNPQPWVVYNNYHQKMKRAFKSVRRQADAVLGLTHLTLTEDRSLINKMKRIPLFMGGHEHQHNYVIERKGAIAKADANAKSMYRHLVFREGKRKKIKIISQLINVDSTVLPDPEIAAVVKVWEDKAYASFRAGGLEPAAVVSETLEPLDGTEAAVRYRQTNLGSIITASMRAASPGAALAVLNSGSIRIDDFINGVITQLDVIRTLPFGGRLCEVTLTGEVLARLLTTGNGLRSQGGYLQLSANTINIGGAWLIDQQAIKPSGRYVVVAPDFLFSGAEKGLEFLKAGTPGIDKIQYFDAPGDPRSDIRLAVIKYLADTRQGRTAQ